MFGFMNGKTNIAWRTSYANVSRKLRGLAGDSPEYCLAYPKGALLRSSLHLDMPVTVSPAFGSRLTFVAIDSECTCLAYSTYA